MSEYDQREASRLRSENESLNRKVRQLEQLYVAPLERQLQHEATLNTIKQSLAALETQGLVESASTTAMSDQLTLLTVLIEQVQAEQPDNQPVVDVLNGFTAVLDSMSQRITANHNAVISSLQPFLAYLSRASAVAQRVDTMLTAVEQKLRGP